MRRVAITVGLAFSLSAGCGQEPARSPGASTPPSTRVETIEWVVALDPITGLDSVLVRWGRDHDVRVRRVSPDSAASSTHPPALVEIAASAWPGWRPRVRETERPRPVRRDPWRLFRRGEEELRDWSALARAARDLAWAETGRGPVDAFAALAVTAHAWPVVEGPPPAVRFDDEAVIEAASFFAEVFVRARRLSPRDLEASGTAGLRLCVAPASWSVFFPPAEGWRVQALPGPEGPATVVACEDHLLVRPVRSPHPDLGEELARFLASDAVVALRRADRRAGAWAPEELDADSWSYVVPPWPAEARRFEEHLRDALESILEHRRSPADAMERAARRWSDGT